SSRSQRLPREVWVASISQNKLTAVHVEEMIDKLLARMEEVTPLQPDIICLPEVGPFGNLSSERPAIAEIAEKPPGAITERFAEFAKTYRCYVWCPIYTKEAGHYYNALVLIDRQGKVVGEYRKMHPTVGEINKGISPGSLTPPVFHTDFGTVGAQICFDIEWLDGWQRLGEAGAEMVFWSSAFGGGTKLNMLANLFRYIVVSSTRKGVTRLCDITGETVAWTGLWETWVCAPVNLEKAFLHTWPFVHKFNDIRRKYGQAIRLTTYHEEEWSIIESLSPDVKVADVLKEFEIKTYDEVVQEATSLQMKHRGF
ncbi:MAG: carbon-nitrogen hydrolase family protein, partial [Gemmatimonadota bacterium]|nr:carbon-nitrogen hydrolase family protein [Gemmatimonadota bacterium]